MTEIAMLLGVVGSAIVVAILWKLAYENGKLKELVKQKDAEIKRYKMERDVALRRSWENR